MAVHGSCISDCMVGFWQVCGRPLEAFGLSEPRRVEAFVSFWQLHGRFMRVSVRFHGRPLEVFLQLSRIALAVAGL